MKKFVLLAGVATLALAACNKEENTPAAVDKAQDAVGAAVGQVAAGGLGNDTAGMYVPNAAMGDMYEIMAADIAIQRSKNPQVLELARMIKADHTAASNMMKQSAPQAAPDVQLPTSLDQRRQGLIDNLRSAPAEAFDETYIDQQIAAHQEAITLHRGFSDNEGPAALVQHATQVLPKIEAHLRQAQQIDGALGSGGAAASGGAPAKKQ